MHLLSNWVWTHSFVESTYRERDIRCMGIHLFSFWVLATCYFARFINSANGLFGLRRKEEEQSKFDLKLTYFQLILLYYPLLPLSIQMGPKLLRIEKNNSSIVHCVLHWMRQPCSMRWAWYKTTNEDWIKRGKEMQLLLDSVHFFFFFFWET